MTAMTPRLKLLLALAAIVPPAVRADEVILDYKAKAATVTQLPFGITVPLLTEFIGVIVYDTTTGTDSRPGDPQRGIYHLVSGGAFEARFLEHRITGSGTPELQVEDILVSGRNGATIDTFRFIDGDRIINPPGVMSFDGTTKDDLELGLAITDGDGAAFSNDLLPTLFPMLFRPDAHEYPHTFSLSDDGGRVSLQFDCLIQRSPNRPKIIDVRLDGDNPSLLFHSKPDQTYSVEFSTDLNAWQIIAPDLASEGYLTGYVDSDIIGRLELDSLPEKAFYRVRENP